MSQPNIVDFIEYRLTEMEQQAPMVRDSQQQLRIVDALRACCVGVVNQLERNDLDPTDNPLAAGLLVIANIWSDHPDFAVPEWFPRMSQMGGPINA